MRRVHTGRLLPTVLLGVSAALHSPGLGSVSPLRESGQVRWEPLPAACPVLSATPIVDTGQRLHSSHE